jgi:methyl coenzyme M reductase subunit C
MVTLKQFDILTPEELQKIETCSLTVIDKYNITDHIIIELSIVIETFGQIVVTFYNEIPDIISIHITLSEVGYVNRGFEPLYDALCHELAHVITFVRYRHVDHNEQFDLYYEQIKSYK